MTGFRRLSVVVAAIAALGSVNSLSGSADAAAKPLVAERAGAYHDVAPGYAGFNAPFRGNSWQALSPRLRKAAAGLQPGAIRIFGGSTANYWNWRSGKLYDYHGVPGRLRHASQKMRPVHIGDWARLVRDANAMPVFDLNVVTSTLSDQLDMLHAAARRGMPIRWIELGNELYFSQPLIEQRFPTPEAYGKKASRWIEAIEAEFPDAEVAAVGLGYRSPDSKGRRAGWDRRLLKTLHGESALTFHTYWTAPRRGPLTGARLAAAMTGPIRRLQLLRSGALERLPKGVDAWVTEWNVWHIAALRGTWANGLGDAEYLLGLLGEPSVAQEDLHPLVHSKPVAALFGNPNGFADGTDTVRFAPTAVGEAMSVLYPALHGGVVVGELHVPNAPRIPGTRITTVRGVALQGGGALFVNVGGTRELLSLPPELACDGTLDSVWARPAERITGKAGEVRRATVATQGTFSLPAYSVNRLSC